MSRKTRKTKGTANPVDKHVGARVRIRRQVLGLSQEKLADNLGLTFQQIQKYERGMNRISAGRLYDLSNVLQVPVAYFYQGLGVIHWSPCSDETLLNKETIEIIGLYNSLPDPLRKRMRSLLKEMGVMQEAVAA